MSADKSHNHDDNEDLAENVALEEQSIASPPPLAEPEPPVRAQQQRPSYRQPEPESEIDNERDRIVDDLRHKLFIQEHEKKKSEEMVKKLEQMVKTKDTEIASLKNQLQSKQPSTSTPQSLSAAPFVETSNTMESSHLSSQQQTSASTTQENMDLLKLLFADILKETNKSRSMTLNKILVPAQIQEYARLFCLKLQPTDDACSPNAKRVLSLLASDIEETIVQSENPRSTIPSLLNLFSLCLSTCIEQSLHGIISTIVAVLNRLATFFALAVAQLVKEAKRDLTSSIVYKLVLALPLYGFQKPPPFYHVVEEFPSIVHSSFTDIIRLAEKYGTLPHKIAKAIKYKKPPAESQDTVMRILSILTAVGAEYSDARLSFLFTDRNFLNLLSVSTPVQVLDKACAVLALSIRDKDFVELPWNACDEGVPLFGVSQLCKLLGSEEQHGNSPDPQWYSLWYEVCNLLHSATTLALPDGCATQTRKAILSSVISFLVDTCAYDLHGKKDLKRLCKSVVESAGQALLATVESLQDVKTLDEYTIVTLRELVEHYNNVPSLLDVEKWLNQQNE